MASRDKDRTNLNYAAAIGVSALAHAVLLYLMLFTLPRWLKADQTPPPAYTVAIVDNLPAGDLGTHLPPLSGGHHHHEAAPPPEEEPPQGPEEKPPPKSGTKIEAPDNDRNAIALNNVRPTDVPTPEPTATPTPQPVETPEPTAAPSQAPTPPPTARPTHRPRPTMRPTMRLRPTMRPTPRPRHGEARRIKPPAPKMRPKIMIARAAPLPRAVHTPSVRERLFVLHRRLMEEHLKELARVAKARPPAEPETGDDTGDDTEGDETTAPEHGEHRGGGGPVAANSVTNGHGYGVGSGGGSLGILRDPEFLLYYQKVQERIKDAWSFASASPELTTTVNFAIAPDGRLTGLEITYSSNNASFDQSVERAIRRAAPFPPPPERYRDQFAQGVQAIFKLGELRS
ncbi:MAG TPA: energy transducer TonB [Candidatus Binataceae bacterium]|nr:energy transducer TonB [Candidatus Binataceae bacterium]